MPYVKPSLLHYRVAQVASWFAATFLFGRRIQRNEIKGQKGPFVVLANHQCALDFVNLIGLRAKPMSFVISRSIFCSLPISGFLARMGVIPKQQFQTTVRDMKRMKAVIDRGETLVIYPAGLMCEDGLSTPIPEATYKFLKWLDVDVYVARTRGSYFVMPKWTTGFRPGRTYMDVYKLFDRQELRGLELDAVRQRTRGALLFDAYREQQELRIPYRGGRKLRGLEQVLYQCPHCHREFTMASPEDTCLRCNACGYEVESDRYGLLQNKKGLGPALTCVSDWSRLILQALKEKVRTGEETGLAAPVTLGILEPETGKFRDGGRAVLTLTEGKCHLLGAFPGGERAVSMVGVPTLPFSPGKYLEIQDGETIYRCCPEDGRLVMKFINLVKIFYECSHSPQQPAGTP